VTRSSRATPRWYFAGGGAEWPTGGQPPIAGGAVGNPAAAPGVIIDAESAIRARPGDYALSQSVIESQAEVTRRSDLSGFAPKAEICLFGTWRVIIWGRPGFLYFVDERGL
jgi:hypothetical protein